MWILKSSWYFLTLPIFLTGCAGMNSTFDCNVASGGKCAPMSSINAMANRGLFQRSYGKEKAIDYSKLAGSGDSDSLLRVSDGVQQIWIAPYEDVHGIYHDASSVYVVAKKGHWTGKPPLAIVEDDET